MLLYLIEFAASVTAQSVHLRTPGEPVHIGKEVVFSCKATVNGNLMWLSDHFIGNSGRTLSFPSIAQPGSQMSNTLHPNNYAFLKSVNNDTGIPELTSTLHVQVEGPIDGLCTVTCMTTDRLESSATFKILGNTYIYVIYCTCTCIYTQGFNQRVKNGAAHPPF